MFHSANFNNGFLTTGGKTFCCPSSIRRAVKEKLAHFVNKMSHFAQIFFGISRLNLEVVFRISTPPDDVIIMSFAPKGLKNKFYQITSTLILFERCFIYILK